MDFGLLILFLSGVSSITFLVYSILSPFNEKRMFLYSENFWIALVYSGTTNAVILYANTVWPAVVFTALVSALCYKVDSSFEQTEKQIVDQRRREKQLKATEDSLVEYYQDLLSVQERASSLQEEGWNVKIVRLRFAPPPPSWLSSGAQASSSRQAQERGKGSQWEGRLRQRKPLTPAESSSS